MRLLQFIRRYPYWVLSLAVHAALLAQLYYTGWYLPEQDVQQRRVAASSRADSHAAMRARVSDMERIKDLMRESLGDAADGAGNVRFDATTAPPAPADMLAQAEALARDIDALGARARIDVKPVAPGPDAGAVADAGRAQPALPPQQDPAEALAGPGPAPQGDAAAGAPDRAPAGTASAEASAALAGKPAGNAAGEQAGAPSGTASAASAASASMAGNPGSPADASSGAGGGAGISAAGAAARIASLEQRARDVLAQRQRQLEQAGQGKPGNASTAGPGAAPSGVAARIATFFKRNVSDEGWASGSYRTTGMELFHQGSGRMAHVDTAAMRKGAGRLLGAGGGLANRVYVNSWYLIGPFAGKHGTGMFENDSHPPEQAVVLDAAYRGKDGRFLTWRYVKAAAYPLIPPDPQEDSVYYGYTEVMMDTERELAVWIGADDDAQVWINDQLVWKGGNVNKRWFFQEIYDTGVDYSSAYNLNEGKVLVRFRRGRNKLFFKLSNGPTRTFFSMVLAPA